MKRRNLNTKVGGSEGKSIYSVLEEGDKVLKGLKYNRVDRCENPLVTELYRCANQGDLPLLLFAQEVYRLNTHEKQGLNIAGIHGPLKETLLHWHVHAGGDKTNELFIETLLKVEGGSLALKRDSYGHTALEVALLIHNTVFVDSFLKVFSRLFGCGTPSQGNKKKKQNETNDLSSTLRLRNMVRPLFVEYHLFWLGVRGVWPEEESFFAFVDEGCIEECSKLCAYGFSLLHMAIGMKSTKLVERMMKIASTDPNVSGVELNVVYKNWENDYKGIIYRALTSIELSHQQTDILEDLLENWTERNYLVLKEYETSYLKMKEVFEKCERAEDLVKGRCFLETIAALHLQLSTPPLHFALRSLSIVESEGEKKRLFKIARLLLGGNGACSEANPELFAYYSDTSALSMACQSGDTGLVKLMLKRGANPNHLDTATQKTLLGEAMERKNLDVLRLLLEAGANPNVFSSYFVGEDFVGVTPLHMLCLLDDPKCENPTWEGRALRILFNDEPDSVNNGKNDKKSSSASLPSKKNKRIIPDVNATCSKGHLTPLKCAVISKKYSLAKLLVNFYGADVNHRLMYGRTFIQEMITRLGFSVINPGSPNAQLVDKETFMFMIEMGSDLTGDLHLRREGGGLIATTNVLALIMQRYAFLKTAERSGRASAKMAPIYYDKSSTSVASLNYTSESFKREYFNCYGRAKEETMRGVGMKKTPESLSFNGREGGKRGGKQNSEEENFFDSHEALLEIIVMAMESKKMVLCDKSRELGSEGQKDNERHQKQRRSSKNNKQQRKKNRIAKKRSKNKNTNKARFDDDFENLYEIEDTEEQKIEKEKKEEETGKAKFECVPFDINGKITPDYGTLLQFSCTYSLPDITRLALEHGANVNALVGSGVHPLYAAVDAHFKNSVDESMEVVHHLLGTPGLKVDRPSFELCYRLLSGSPVNWDTFEKFHRLGVSGRDVLNNTSNCSKKVYNLVSLEALIKSHFKGKTWGQLFDFNAADQIANQGNECIMRSCIMIQLILGADAVFHSKNLNEFEKRCWKFMHKVYSKNLVEAKRVYQMPRFDSLVEFYLFVNRIDFGDYDE